MSFEELFSLLPSHPAGVGTGSQGWSLRTGARCPSLHAREAERSGQGSVLKPAPQGQSSASLGLPHPLTGVQTSRVWSAGCSHSFAHPSFTQQPLPGQAPRWVLAVGLDTSQMDGHVLGEAGLLTHLFFCNVSIRATRGTGDTVKQRRVPTLRTRRLKGPHEPNRSDDVSRLGRKLWVTMAGGKPCCQQGVPVS